MEITTRNRVELKSYFVKNSIPTEGNFADFIDGVLNQVDDGVVKLPGNPLVIQAEGDAASTLGVLHFYRDLAEDRPEWTLSMNPRTKADDPQTARRGLSINDGDGKSRLFIDRGSGRLGFGTMPADTFITILGDRGTVPVGITQQLLGGSATLEFTTQDSSGKQATRLLFRGNGDVADTEFYRGGRGAEALSLYIRGDDGHVGVGTKSPHGTLHVVGSMQVDDGSSITVRNGHMAAGSLTIGSLNANYGGGTGWSNNTAGLMLDTRTNTEIAVHDSNTRLASLMYYQGDNANQVTIGRDMGWGTLARLHVAANVTQVTKLAVGGAGGGYTIDTSGANGIKLGLEGRGGGQFIITNNPNDNKIYLEGFSKDGKDHAAEMLLTGRHAARLPRLSFYATHIYANGNLGIGNNAPAHKLVVEGNYNAGKDSRSGMNGGGNIAIVSNAPQIDFIDTDHNDWSIHVNSNKMYFIRQPWEHDDLVLDGAGRVGVGTSSPNNKLTVTGGYIAADQVAFSAYVDQNTRLGDIDVLPMQATSKNRGDHYNHSTSKFTAPVKGMYLFTMTAFRVNNPRDGWLHWYLRVNNGYANQGGSTSAENAERSMMSWETNTWGTASRTMILLLNANDQVYVMQRGIGRVDNFRSGFEGMLIFATP